MDKPLPNIPAASSTNPRGARSSINLNILSVEGRNHLRRFILQSLEEEAPNLPEHEVWVDVLDGALRQLGESITSGGWLPGIRRARVLRKVLESKRTSVCSHSEKKGGHNEEVMVKSNLTEQPPTASKKQDAFAETTSPPDPDDSRKKAFASLKDFTSRPVVPIPKPSAKHVLLTTASFGSFDASAELEYEVLRSNAGCVFSPRVFTFPPDYSKTTDGDAAILYGLTGWPESPPDDGSLQVVGGAFTLVGLSNVSEHASLVKILKLSIFFYLSLVLEQHTLSDSHVTLHFQKTPFPIPEAGPMQRTLSSSSTGSKHKKDPVSGLWAYLSKKKDNILHRAIHAGPAPLLTRSGSLDLALSHRSGTKPRPPRTSDDGESPRARKLSFIADFRPSFLSPKEREQSTASESPPFESAVALLKRYGDMLSTSPGVKFSPPLILIRLAERESSDLKRKLTGDEKAALSSLLGWVGRREPAKHMVGTCGFVRQQGISLLYSEHVPVTSSNGSGTSTPSSSLKSSSTLSLPPPSVPPKLTPCGNRRNWATHRFYGENDESLGEAVIRFCTSADDPCKEPGCGFKRGQHELRWIHGGTRIVVSISTCSDANDKKATEHEDDLPRMWESCAICQKKSLAAHMQDGTYLLSFAKYVELLVYSSSIFRLTKPLCDHTKYSQKRPSSAHKESLPQMRFNIVRNFMWRDRVLAFTLSPVHDIYEVTVPRLQIMKGRPGEKNDDSSPTTPDIPLPADDERKKLRREIMKFWQGLSDHMDLLEEKFVHDDTERYHSKTLPRLPSVDEDDEHFDDGVVTPKGGTSKLPSHPPNTPQTPEKASTPSEHPSDQVVFPFPTASQRSNTPPASNAAPSTSSTMSTTSLAPSSVDSNDTDSLYRLTNLRHTFQKTEQNLYTELSHTPGASLNDVRRSFQSAARGATKRLAAWETKHAANLGDHVSIPSGVEPDWWQSGCHAVPGGNVIVREDDWGSIIAFTLSSLDYHRELSSMSTANARSVSNPVTPLATPDSLPRPSFFSKTVPGKWFTQTSPSLDPDQEGVVWHEPEAYSAVISRKEHPRDPASLLMTIPDVLRQKNVQDSNGASTSRFVTLGLSSGKSTPQAPPPPSAWAKPEVQISMDAAGGKLTSGAPAEVIDKLLHDLDGAPELSGSKRNSASDSYGSSSFVETNIRRGKASSIMSTDSDTPTIGRGSNRNSQNIPPPLPPKDTSTPCSAVDENGGTTPSKSSISTSLTNTLTAAFRYMVKAEEPQPPPKHHHGLLHTTYPAIDERPHIKYDWTIGKRLKFSCTVYYARQFDSLRKRCGINDLFLTSLSRSDNWLAEGGKSKSNFWKTSDDQFIIKTLVNAWNVADLQVLIDLGPSYFRYMDATANKPTVLAKLLGFYTVEIRNLETGTTQAKADLLVMENLFYSQKIARTFDLKGIQGRRVKAAPHGGSVSKTLFDGDWMEGQQKALTLLHPHSKFTLDEAIRADCEFLAKSNIMDYSLLLGVCEERKLLACGLVDTIGSYTFAKTLEYKAKQGLNSGKEVTVVPPNEYQQRFVNAMDNYFLACPDRWTRPMDDTIVPSDYDQLPSVL